MATNFIWGPDGSLPRIEEHTKRKLDVLKNYLDVYFDTVVRNPAQDRLNITLVDGFSGGGAYSDGNGTRAGSPLVLLNAVEEASVRLNEGRAKPLEINARFIFVDDEREHVAALKRELRGRGYKENDPQISVLEGKFVEHLPTIMAEITQTQRKGRSIFFLDQFGYSDVPMSAIQTIFSALDRAEVVLNFAIDSLLNYLQDASAELPLYQQFGIDSRFIADWRQRKDEHMGRALTQRALMAHIHAKSGAKFFTPFMLWSRTDNRWMMLAHLSQHQAARDKMLSVHWQEQNSFTHIGSGSLFSLGYDTRLIESCDSLFNFSEIDRTKLNTELVNALPAEVHQIMENGQLDVARLLDEIGNRTAGTNDDIFQVLSELAQARELEVLSANGTPKRAGTRISIKDRLIRPSQPTLFFPSRW
ncbi:three-Cys-motif partner protein TcmP [Frigidibacter sp. SD6-1]|uniref:three-Cys-motif partner protein TcmP n=1 Tax=Frigidibacter sp. SD6-1 TaxID=3032581 RepID=UPI0024DF494C|nr:three-Cys-motif partner protein TcmP [Frigidibacter sp. SD6-1]